MTYNWNLIKTILKAELQDAFNDPNQPVYSFSFEDGLDLFCKTLIYRTGQNDLDGIESRVIPTLHKYYILPKDKNDSFNYLTQVATKLDTFLQKIVFLSDHSRYLHLKSQNKGMYHYLVASGINPNNINFGHERSSISNTALTTNFGSQLYEAYNLRNIEAHSANDYSDEEVPRLFKSSLIIYLFAVFEHYSLLSSTVGHVAIPESLKIDEIMRDLTPAAEYEIDLSKVVGRENDLAALTEKITLNADKITVLKSIGGIGKTTLLKAYAKENKNSFNQIIWVFYQNDLVSTFINNTVLLENLGISANPNFSEFENYKLTMNAIKKLGGKTLLLIDDLKDDKFEIYSQLPLSDSCQIIGTTRINLTYPFISLADVGFLDFDAAKILFTEYYPGTVSSEILKELFDYIGYHTLTIELLAKTLQTNFTIRGVGELIDKLKNQTISNESWQVDIESQYDNESINLKNHLLGAFRLISLSPLENRILSHLSILPVMLFSGQELKSLFEIDDSQDTDFINALSLLVKRGWINAQQSMYQMHAMIQEVIKAAVVPNLAESLPLIGGLCSFLDVSEYISIRSKIKYISCAQHVLSIIDGDCEHINMLNNMVAVGLSNNGDYANALTYAGKALVYAKKIKDDHKVYQTYSTLGMINRHLGNLPESEKSYEKAIEIIEVTDPMYIDALSVYLSYGTLLEQLGERRHIERAKELYDYAFRELEYFLSRNKNEKQYMVLSATILNNLGKIYSLLDQYPKAIALQQEAYDKLKDLLGDKHEIVAITANNLGLSYAYNKKFEDSMKYHTIAVAIIEEIFDENHPEYSTTKTGLANAYKNIGEDEKAKAIFKELLEIARRNLPEDHPTMARRVANYASVCILESERETAKELYFEAIKIDVHNYGENYPNVATCHMNIGNILLHERQVPSAYEHLTKAQRIYRFNKIDNELSKAADSQLESLRRHYPKLGQTK